MDSKTFTFDFCGLRHKYFSTKITKGKICRISISARAHNLSKHFSDSDQNVIFFFLSPEFHITSQYKDINFGILEQSQKAVEEQRSLSRETSYYS